MMLKQQGGSYGNVNNDLWKIMDRHDAGSIFYLSRKRMAEKGLLHHERAGRRERIPGKAEKEEKKTGDLEKSKWAAVQKVFG